MAVRVRITSFDGQAQTEDDGLGRIQLVGVALETREGAERMPKPCFPGEQLGVGEMAVQGLMNRPRRVGARPRLPFP